MFIITLCLSTVFLVFFSPENICLCVEVSFLSGLLNICCYSFFIIIVYCLQSSLRLYLCVIRFINALGKTVLQRPLEPFKINSAFRSAFHYSVCILINLITLHTNHKASCILSYGNLWVPFHFMARIYIIQNYTEFLLGLYCWVLCCIRVENNSV